MKNPNVIVFSDDDVVRSVREGNTRNYEILIDRYKNKIINFIHKMIFDYDEAQSLSQDVFLKVFESIKSYKTQDNFQAFIFTIAKNMTLNYIKKQKRMVFFSSFLPGSNESKHLQVAAEQEEQMETKRREELVTGALKSLKENRRLAVILKVYMGFSYKKIHAITGWSESKIESLVSRGKGDLKNKILAGENMQETGQSNVLQVREA
ncbi:MAG: RNA polymerase sigma factor [bacterium]|nr:RNA polymerase sigma factor [bacterium]